MRTHDHQSLSARMATDVALAFLLVSALRRRAFDMVHLLVRTHMATRWGGDRLRRITK
jgi:hypothetical protein